MEGKTKRTSAFLAELYSQGRMKGSSYQRIMVQVGKTLTMASQLQLKGLAQSDQTSLRRRRAKVFTVQAITVPTGR